MQADHAGLEVYAVCPERNTPEAFRHFFDRAFARFEDPAASSWRLRLARRIALLYRAPGSTASGTGSGA